MLSQRASLTTAALLGFLGVTLGAFGAHALKNLLIANGRLETYELAVRYQFYHALAILLIGILMDKITSNGLKISAILMLVGVILFSGSLYLLALFNTAAVALITPLGGVFLLAGWAFLLVSVIRELK